MMLSSVDDEEGSQSPLLAFLQALLLAAMLVGTALILGGARLWVMLPVYGLTAVLIAVQILRVVRGSRSPVFRFDVTDGFVLAFLVYAVVRYWTAPVEFIARVELLNIFTYATCFWVARYAFTHSSQALFVLYTLAITGIGVATFALWLKANPAFLPYGETLHLYYAPRLLGTFGCPNHLGSFLVICTSVTLGAAMFVRGLWPWRIVLFYGAGLMILVIGLSLSRGSWMGLLFAFLALSIFSMRHSSLKWYFPLAFFLVFVFGGVVTLWQIPLFHERLQEIFLHLQNNTLDQYVRIQLAQDGWKIWMDHFWLGAGPATFEYLHPRYQSAVYNTHAYYTHNDYLNLLTDYGLLGGLLVAGFLLTVTFTLCRHVDHRSRSVYRILLAGAVAAWAALLMHSWVDFNLHIPACAMALFVVTGLGLRRTGAVGAHLPYQNRQSINLGFAALMVVVLVGFCWFGVRTAQGYYPYWQVVKNSPKLNPHEAGEYLAPEAAIPLLEQAVRNDPKALEPRILLGDFYRVAAAQSTSPRERQQMGLQAIQAYQAAAQANPLDDAIIMKQGMVYDLLSRYDEAYLCYRLITTRRPHNGFYHTALGQHFLLRNRPEKATQAFQQAMLCPFGTEEAKAMLQKLQAQPVVPDLPAEVFDHPPTIP